MTQSLPNMQDRKDEEAVAAAYAALGHLAPSAVDMQGELGVANPSGLR